MPFFHKLIILLQITHYKSYSHVVWANSLTFYLASLAKYTNTTKAARYIACDCHAHLLSKAGSVIINKISITCFQMERHLIHRAIVHWQATQYHVQYRMRFICDSEHETLLCALNATPSENRWWRFYNNHRTGFTEEMRMTITCNISCSQTLPQMLLTAKPPGHISFTQTAILYLPRIKIHDLSTLDLSTG